LVLAVASSSFYLYLTMSGGRLLTASEFLRFSQTISTNTLLHFNEDGGSRSLSLAKLAISNPISNEAVEVAGRSYNCPLPKYSVRQGDRHYLTFASADELEDYFQKELAKAGWRQVDQNGSSHLFEGNGARMWITQHFYLGTGISEIGLAVVTVGSVHARE